MEKDCRIRLTQILERDEEEIKMSLSSNITIKETAWDLGNSIMLTSMTDHFFQHLYTQKYLLHGVHVCLISSFMVNDAICIY